MHIYRDLEGVGVVHGVTSSKTTLNFLRQQWGNIGAITIVSKKVNRQVHNNELE